MRSASHVARLRRRLLLGASSSEDSTPLSLVKVWYERARLWIAYASVLFVILVLYLGSFLGPIRDFLLPAALGVLTAFAIQSLQTIERQTGQSVTEGEYANLVAAIPRLQKIVECDDEVTEVKIISATGWTTVRQVLPALCKSSKASYIRVWMQVVDGSGSQSDIYPEHWVSETKRTLSRIEKEFTDPRVSVSVTAYRYLPPVHGLLLNDLYLLVGFFGWAHTGPHAELTGAEEPHRLYRRGDAASSQLFGIFDEWFHHVPREVVYTRRSTADQYP